MQLGGPVPEVTAVHGGSNCSQVASSGSGLASSVGRCSFCTHPQVSAWGWCPGHTPHITLLNLPHPSPTQTK